MKKKHRVLKVSLMTTSIATAGVISYKILKKKYPEKLEDINNYVKDNVSNLKETCIKETNEITEIFYNKLENTSKLINVKKCKYNKKNTSIDDNNKNYVVSNLYVDIDTSNQNFKNSKIGVINNYEGNQIDTDNNFENSNLQNKENIETTNILNSTSNEDNSTNSISFEDKNLKEDLFKDDTANFSDVEPDVLVDTDDSSDVEPNVLVDTYHSYNVESNVLVDTDSEEHTLKDESNNSNKIEELVNNVNINENTDKEVYMPDNYIEDEIRYQLCLTNKEIITENTLKKLERIDFFEIDDFDIDIYCDFLSKYTNIKSIVIDALNPLNADNTTINEDIHCLKNISPLNSLKSLEELSFNWGINYIDFSNLNDLPNLKKLEIKFGMLNNIEFLSNFDKLEHLEVMLSSSIKDISTILNLKNLKNLYIYTNSKLEIEPIKSIPSLQYLYINGESIPLK